MKINKGLEYIYKMVQVRTLIHIISILFYSLIPIIFIGVWLFFFKSSSFILIFSIWLVGFMLLFLLIPNWRIKPIQITEFLDIKYPSLEESSSLFLKDPEKLGVLERLQILKTEKEISSLPIVFWDWLRPLIKSMILLLLASLFSFPIFFLLKSQKPPKISKTSQTFNSPYPKVSFSYRPNSLHIWIYPPKYLNKKPYSVPLGNFKAETGSQIVWTLKTQAPTHGIQILFNGKQSYPFSSNSQNTWVYTKTLDHSCFFQILYPGKSSEIYTLELIPDQIPKVLIIHPPTNFKIGPGEKAELNLEAEAQDDYGINTLVLKATVAKGNGEAVKFKEYSESLPILFSKTDTFINYRIHHDWLLEHFQMGPGDALYYYIVATDTRNQIGKSEVFTLSIQDTTGILNLEGLVSGSNIKPEFFRSERQIILDSEHLIKTQNTLTKEKFNGESNNLGLDQKILRLRYGKFLGEESESDPGSDQEKLNSLGSPSDFGNADKILDAYTDKHDNAEDASFFDASQKAQLKAILNQMWKAELNLRLHIPQSALPFEYKALLLLKDLQQNSRAFVSKSPHHINLFDFSKRLSGDLDGIANARVRLKMEKIKPEEENLRFALELIESIKSGLKIQTQNSRLQWIENWLSSKAIIQPKKYVKAYILFKTICSRSKNDIDPEIYNKKDLDNLEILFSEAIQNNSIPLKPSTFQDKDLSDKYFQGLNQNFK